MGISEIGRGVKGWASLINEGNDKMGLPHQRKKRQDGHPSGIPPQSTAQQPIVT
jgi:hypothetical protein